MKFSKKKIGVILVVVAVLLAVILLLVSGKGGQSAEGGLKVEKNTVEWNQEMESADETADIQIPYYGSIYMEAGSDVIDMVLVNPKENTCYFSYVFLLKDTGEELFHSNLIEPGRALEKVQLKRAVERGNYDLNIRIDTYTLEGQKPLNNAIVSTQLITS